MCVYCDHVELRVIRFRRLLERIDDQPTRADVGLLIQKLNAQKKILHPHELN